MSNYFSVTTAKPLTSWISLSFGSCKLHRTSIGLTKNKNPKLEINIAVQNGLKLNKASE